MNRNLNVQQFPLDKIGQMESFNAPGRTVADWNQNNRGGIRGQEQLDLNHSMATEGYHQDEPGLTDSTGRILLEGHHRYRAAVEAGLSSMPLRTSSDFDMERHRRIHGGMK